MKCHYCDNEMNEFQTSWYEPVYICNKCATFERELPDYQEARRIERQELMKGNTNFPGIGLTAKSRSLLQYMICSNEFYAAFINLQIMLSQEFGDVKYQDITSPFDFPLKQSGAKIKKWIISSCRELALKHTIETAHEINDLVQAVVDGEYVDPETQRKAVIEQFGKFSCYYLKFSSAIDSVLDNTDFHLSDDYPFSKSFDELPVIDWCNNQAAKIAKLS